MSNKPESQQQPAEESAGDQPRDPIDTIFDAVDSDGSPTPVQESAPLTTDTIDDSDPPVDRVAILGKDGRWLSGWALRFIVLTVAAYFLSLILGQIWTGLLPILLAIMLCTVLWPPVRWLRNHKIPPSLAVTITLLGCVSAFGGLFAAMAPTVAHQSKGLVDQAIQGVNTLIDWVQGPPLNIDADQFNTIFNEFVAKIQENGALGKVQEQAGNIASGVFAGLSSASSVAVTLGIMLVLTFFFLKDGDRFLPWVRRNTGPTVGLHLSELFTRIWNTLAGFIRAQAIVSFIDALFIGIGLVLMGVPLALVLATITFFAGFVPIVGAVSAGAISVLIALVSNGPTTALAVLVLILVVQQLEGNILPHVAVQGDGSAPGDCAARCHGGWCVVQRGGRVPGCASGRHDCHLPAVPLRDGGAACWRNNRARSGLGHGTNRTRQAHIAVAEDDAPRIRQAGESTRESRGVKGLTPLEPPLCGGNLQAARLSRFPPLYRLHCR